MGGSSSTISTSETRIEALRLQSSAYGVTVPVVGGTTRLAGNLVYYNGFKAVATTTVTESGGKGGGGGVTQTNTTYTYYASIILALGQGMIQDILRIWKGKERIDAKYVAPQVVRATTNYSVPYTGGSVTVPNASKFTGNIRVYIPASGYEDSDWHLTEGTHYTVSKGVYTFPRYLRSGYWWWSEDATNPACGRNVVIEYNYTEPAYTLSAMQQLGITLVKGEEGADQPPPSWLSTKWPAQAVRYPHLAYVHADQYKLAPGAEVLNHNFEVVGFGAYSISPSIPDCNPVHFSRHILTDGRYGARMTPGTLEAFNDWSNYCLASGLLLSPALTEQMTAAEFITQMGRFTNTAPVWSVDRLKMIPFADKAMTGNGVTFTPNVTPIYDLTEDHFLASASEDSVRVIRKQPSDRYNHVRVEYNNRDNYYNVAVAEVKDDADVATFGLRSMDTVKAEWICTQDVAMKVAQLLLQRSLNVVAEYEFTLPWAFCRLEPMDLVTITEPTQGLDKKVVRIISVEEDENRRLSIRAEDFPEGVATAAQYELEQTQGYQYNYSEPPGSVMEPVFFEAPVNRTTTGLDVYAAVTGDNEMWGGCRVWVSLDGTNYKASGVVNGGARYGTIGAAMTGTTTSVPVTLTGNGGQMLNASTLEAQQNQSLLWVDGAQGGEYMNYVTATLTGTNAYTLSGILRSAYGNPANSHSINAKVVRVDDQIARSGDLDLSYVGKVIYFKFTSFNIFGAAEESLADVASYSYTITGAQLQLPPSNVASITAAVEGDRVRLSWPTISDPDLDMYEVRRGGTAWDNATVVTRVKATSWLLSSLTTGSTTFRVKAIDLYGNYSTTDATTSITITAPGTPTGSWSASGVDATITWAATAGSFPIKEFEVRHGASYAAGTTVARISGTSLTVPITWLGTRTFWIAAIDTANNVGTAGSVAATVTAPSAPNASAAFSGPNCIITWTPGTSTLPIAEYEVRYGASFAAGVSLGKVRTTTMTVRADWSGTRSFWVAAIDQNGNVGTADEAQAVITPAPAPVVTTQVVDNNVLLYWTQAQGTLPIQTFEIRRGATFATADVIGDKSGGFTSVFETVAGLFTYWVVAKDTAGNYGTPGSVSATVNQPPDYILRGDIDSTLSGTTSNLLLEYGELVGPVNATETWDQHFSSRGWASPQAQIDAGYPIYIQPTSASGYYEEVIDYGTLLASSKITVSPNVINLLGTVTVSGSISVSQDGVSYTTYNNTLQLFATNFRYIKVRITLTSSGGDDLAKIAGLNVRLDSKLKTITGMLTCNAADSGGTTLYLTDDRTATGQLVFIDVDAIQLTAQGTTSVTVLYDFTDAPNPLSLKVLMFNSATGARVNGTVSYMIRGF